MFVKREWVTPVIVGAFLLSAVTGVLMFFHFDTGLNKAAHEWLSWVLLGSAALHIVANFSGFKRHFKTRKGQILMGVFALVLLLSFVPAGDKGGPPFAAPIQALSQAPITTLALVAQISPEQLLQRLSKAGVEFESDEQSVSDLVGRDLRAQIGLLRVVLDETD